jgi:uncharacterized protein YjiS (DUF1127 family)
MEMVMSMSSMVAPASQDASAQTAPDGCGTVLKRWWSAYLMWRMETVAIERLRSMSDRDLKDIGLTRASIIPAVQHSQHRW